VAALGTLLPGLLSRELAQGFGLAGGPGLGYVGVHHLFLEQRPGTPGASAAEQVPGTLGGAFRENEGSQARPEELLGERLSELGGGEGRRGQWVYRGCSSPVPLAEDVRAAEEAQLLGNGCGNSVTVSGLPGHSLGVPWDTVTVSGLPGEFRRCTGPGGSR